MVDQARRGAPTPPVALELGAGGIGAQAIRARFEASEVPVSDAVIERLRGICHNVDTDLDARADASRDWWPLTVSWALRGEVPARAAALAQPASASEVAAVLAVCNDARVPVTAMGGRSGVCGNAVPIFGGVLLDLTGLAGIAGVDDESLLIDVAAGTFGNVLEENLRADHGLTLGHWPQSIALSTVGGWVACRGAGQYSTRYGKIEDMVAGLQVALADGRVIRTGGAGPRAATGPDLTQLFVGSEGTLGVVTEARLRVHPVPAGERRAAFGFGSFAEGLDACRRILRRGATPAVLRLYDEAESRSGFGAAGIGAGVRGDRDGGDRDGDARGGDGGDIGGGGGGEGELGALNVLIILDEGDPAIIDGVMSVVVEECVSLGARRLDPELVQHWLDRRDDVSALEGATRAGLTVDTIEVAARWQALTAMYREVVDAVSAVDGTLFASGHQSHAYRDGGCLYFTFAGRPASDGAAGATANAGDAYYRRVWDLVMAITLAHGGAISHHHGIGLNRGRHLARALGPAFDVLVAVKQALDPCGVLNPGKLGLPSPFGEVPWP
jgi:alkyldihydroxyacetonephosphate synthase